MTQAAKKRPSVTEQNKQLKAQNKDLEDRLAALEAHIAQITQGEPDENVEPEEEWEPATEVVVERAAPKKVYFVRNLHNKEVHIRYGTHKDPKPLNLRPRGTKGDVSSFEAKDAGDGSLLAAVDTLFEVITETEANQLSQSYYRPQRADNVQVITEADQNVLTAPDWDGKGRNNPLQQTRTFGASPQFADVPGADVGLHGALREDAAAHDALMNQKPSALPPEGFVPARVVIEKASGLTNQHTLQ